MSNYKVGDLASLMSPSSKKPGSKLQSLFNEHWNRNPNTARDMKSQTKSSPLSCDTESNTSKKKKKKHSQDESTVSSPLNGLVKETETDFNSDFLPLPNKKKQFKEENSNFEKKRKRSISENLAVVEHPKNVKAAFIRCAKNKRQKTVEQESVDTSSIEPHHVKESLFSESAGSENSSKFQPKKKKNKKSKQPNQNSSNAHLSVKTEGQERDDSVNIEPGHQKDDHFSESPGSENPSEFQPKKKKPKRKVKQSHQNSSNANLSAKTEDQESDDAVSIGPGHLKDNLFSESTGSENTSGFQPKKKKSKKSEQPNQNSTNPHLSGKIGEREVDSSDMKDVGKSRVDAEKIRQQNIKDLPCTLFVGNLPISIDRKMLTKLFASFGHIKSVRLRGAVSTKMSIPKKVAEIKNEYHKGLQSHKGFVVFKDVESAKNALTLNGMLIDNHHIVVDFANQAGDKKLYSDNLSVFIGNLPFDVDDETVRSAFDECGEIHALRIIRDKNTGLGKGFGYIEFQKIKSKERALTLGDLEISGRKIRVKPIDTDHGTKRGPKKTVMMIRNNMAMKRTKETGNKKSVKKLLKKGKQVHKKKQIARLLGEKFVK